MNRQLMPRWKRLPTLALLAALLQLLACGDDHSADDRTAPAIGEPPVIELPVLYTADEGSDLVLVASARASADRNIQRVRWERLPPLNPPLPRVDGEDDNRLELTLPQVASDTDLRFRFTATDSAGLSQSADTTVRVRDVIGNQPPVVRIAPVAPVRPPQTVVLDGCDSSDSDGDIVSFRWLRLDTDGTVVDEPGDSCQINVTFEQAPASDTEVRFRLVVTDDQSAMAQADINIQLLADAASNTAPRLTQASASPQPARPGESVLLSAQARDDEGHPLQFRWRQIDGPQVSILFEDTANAEVQVLEAGHYRFEVSVRDDGTAPAQADKRQVDLRVEPAADSREPGLSTCIRNPFARGCPLSPLSRLFAGDSYSACLANPTADPCLLAQLTQRGLGLFPPIDSAGDCTPDNGVDYPHFWGSWHNHTAYSDGAAFTRPADVFAQVKARGFDFATTTDHSDNARLPIALPDTGRCLDGNPLGCLLSDPENLPDNLRKWQATLEQARAATTPQFTALRGFEWTSDRFGHANVLLSRHLVNAKTGPGYLVSMDLFWQWFMYPARLGGGNDGLLVFNHPGREDAIHGPLTRVGLGDPAYAFNDFRYIPGADYRVVGVEVFGKGSEYDSEGVGGSWLAHALDKGWYLAPFGSEDHHDTDWGARSLPKTVIIARTRSLEDLKEGLLARRVYAVAQNANDLRLDFQFNDGLNRHAMGARVVTPVDNGLLTYHVSERSLNAPQGLRGQPIVELMARSADKDERGHYQPLQTQTGHQGQFMIETMPEQQWYFLRIRDSHDNRIKAVSAPIWVSQGNTPLPTCQPL